MAVDGRRLSLATQFLDDCYKQFDGQDLSSKGNVVRNYTSPATQVAYSVMYFAKHVGCWSALRELLNDSASTVYSIGAGPLFCLMGWYFDRPPSEGDKIYGLDFLDWAHVRGLGSHQALLADVLDGAKPELPTGLYFPDELPPQCHVGVGQNRAINAERICEGSTVLFPMVLNHLLGGADPVADTNSLFAWFRRLQQRAGRIVIVDMEATKVPELWQRLEPLTALSGPPLFQFRAHSKRLSPCYGNHEISGRPPESERRTGIRYPQFCQVTACTFERSRGWRWLVAG
ncbi:MAG: hypothetical protein KC431_04555 [Myxococcales bacterium]|nr:hypothetical protein [Myxococcales bacterium]